MTLTPSLFKALANGKLKVWVLAPGIFSEDDNISYYYDFSQSILEYTRVFSELKIDWKWQEVNMVTYEQVIEAIVAEKNAGFMTPVVLNLCDGDEINGAPGLSVVKLLSEKRLVFTGADEYFYSITTSKIPMKQAFDRAHVSNSPWASIQDETVDSDALFNKLGSPLIIKPAVSGGSMGVGIKNVVDNNEALTALIKTMFAGYRGWNLTADGIIAEQFISGPEYTVLITGSFDHPESATIHTPVERVFHPSLPDREKFLSFDRLWEIYEEETPIKDDENFYDYRLPDKELIGPLKKLSWLAYCATRGTGYTRVDIRMDSKTRKLYVLEVNAQCGLSEDEDFTSIGAILRLGGKSFAQLIMEILNDAFIRSSIKTKCFSQLGNNARA